MPLIGVVIPAFNAEGFIEEAIESVLAQTHPHIECVVVDDGSSDGTAAAAGRFGDQIRLLRQGNRGVSAARNRGAAETSAELLAFLDADDRWHPERLERGASFLRENPGCEAVVCATKVVDRRLRPIRIVHHDPHATARDLLLCQANVVSTSSNMLITRDCFDAVGRFDECLSTSADWAMTFRLVSRGTLGAIAEPLVDYRLHDANMSSSLEGFEIDMLRAFDDVFASPSDLELQALRRRAYANLHRMIAGSYFVAGRLGPFLNHAARSIGGHPSTLPYFLGLFARRWRKARAGP